MKFQPLGNIVEGPRGMRMPESLARQIEDAGKGLPKDFGFRRMAKTVNIELTPGSRSDVSTITTDAVDHQKEVVLPNGIDLTVFLKNPIVPFAHNYDAMPVGKCAWIKPSNTGNGLAAMTKYATRPANWSGDWLPDAIVSLMQEGMMGGKSIGFIPTHVRSATASELSTRPDWKGADAIIDKSVLLEYSCVSLPCNPEALSTAVSKSLSDKGLADMILKAAGVDKPVEEMDEDEQQAAMETVVSFVSPATLAAYRARQLAGLGAQIESQATAKITDAIDRLRGRV